MSVSGFQSNLRIVCSIKERDLIKRKRSNTCYSGGRARSKEEEKQHMLLRREGSSREEEKQHMLFRREGFSREEEKQHMLLRREGFSREEEKQLLQLSRKGCIP
jgi:hypothetical protein